MAMAARYHGRMVDLSGAHQRFFLSLKAAGLHDLMNMADELGFGARAFGLEPGSA